MANFRFSTSFATADGPWCGNDDEEQKATTERVQKRLFFLKLCKKEGKASDGGNEPAKDKVERNLRKKIQICLNFPPLNVQLSPRIINKLRNFLSRLSSVYVHCRQVLHNFYV